MHIKFYMHGKIKAFFVLSILTICTSYAWMLAYAFCPKLPKAGDKPILYSNQCRQDLRLTILSALENAKKSIFLVMFGLSDRAVLQALENKAAEYLDMKVFFDKRSSVPFYLSNEQAYPIQVNALLHQKIVVVDNSLVFIGSANLTKASLTMHDNLMIGLYSPEIARFLSEKAPFDSGYLRSMVGGQNIELFLLPDKQEIAFNAVKQLLRSARKQLTVAMFTLTHESLIQEVIKAHKRGVRTEVFIDYHSSLGASSSAVETLKNAGVPTYISRGPQLFHHKYILIDERTLLAGSANWTKSAFYKNTDCFVILHNLSNQQTKFLQKLGGIIEAQSYLQEDTDMLR